jgi:hypothetical protein
MTSLPETSGIVRAAAGAGLPVLVSPTIEPDGRLADGTPLGDFVAARRPADVRLPRRVHGQLRPPEPPRPVLARRGRRGRAWLARFRGMRANASAKTHAELDNSTRWIAAIRPRSARRRRPAARLRAEDRGRLLRHGRRAPRLHRRRVPIA